jgi:hypothetical protein
MSESHTCTTFDVLFIIVVVSSHLVIQVNSTTDLNNALIAAGYGDRIVLAEGFYNLSSALTIGGKALTIESIYGEPEKTFLQCSGSVTTLLSLNNGESFDTVFKGRF